MRDQVSWAFYIGNFTFLVGVAAAAVLLVIPAYVYQWKPIKEVVILGELLAITRDRDVPAVRPGGHRPPGPAAAHGAVRRHAQLAARRSWPGTRSSSTSTWSLNVVLVALHPLHGLPRRDYRQAHLRAARAPLDPAGDLDPHRDRLPLQRHGGAALLERLDPGAALPRLGVLLGPGGDADPLPDPAPHRRASRSRTRRSGRSPS